MTTNEAARRRSGPVRALAEANLAIKFFLELYALALLAYWGAVTGDGAWAVVLGVVAPAAMIAIWGTFAAPRSARRLRPRARIPLELGIFALASAAGYAAGAVVPAIAFAVIAVANALALTFLQQWEG